MTEPRRLLTRLLEYIEEQAKEIDPRQFCLSNAKGFIRRSDQIAGLPGVKYDIKVEGDHIWLRVARFTPSNPPAVPDQLRAFIRASSDPDGDPPALDDAAFRKWLNKTADGKTPERRSEFEKQGRATVGKVVSQLNPEITKREILTTTRAIDHARSELTDLDKRVDEIAAAQLADISVDGVMNSVRSAEGAVELELGASV